MSTNRVSYDESRRVFRGRGGANDSKLPKYQARRRKGSRTAVKGTTKYDNDGNQLGTEDTFDAMLRIVNAAIQPRAGYAKDQRWNV